MIESLKILSDDEKNNLLKILQNRFENNMNRHNNLVWTKVLSNLEANQNKLSSLYLMETTGGEPDVIAYDEHSNKFIFYDCAAKSPIGRRNLCYDQIALESRKNNKPLNSAINMAEEMGINILNENDYKTLQDLGEFDTKTSSWIQTPSSIRDLGGAVFCDRRYNTVFTYHNSAESYYSSRGFRGKLEI